MAGSALFTSTQREYLAGDKDPAYERTMRTRIRKRLVLLPDDLALAGNLSEADIEQVACQMDADSVEAAIEYLEAVQSFKQAQKELHSAAVASTERERGGET